MHQEIRRNLEDYLRADHGTESGSGLPAEFQAHLGECTECSSELKLLQEQAQLLRSLGSPQEVEPHAGFYARVMERIEREPASIWAVLLQRRVGFRLAVASAAMVALLATYLVTSEAAAGPEFTSAPVVASTDLGQSASVQRDAVLVDLASFHQ